MSTRKVKQKGKIGCANCRRIFTLTPRVLEIGEIKCPCGCVLEIEGTEAIYN